MDLQLWYTSLKKRYQQLLSKQDRLYKYAMITVAFSGLTGVTEELLLYFVALLFICFNLFWSNAYVVKELSLWHSLNDFYMLYKSKSNAHWLKRQVHWWVEFSTIIVMGIKLARSTHNMTPPEIMQPKWVKMWQKLHENVRWWTISHYVTLSPLV